MASLDTPLKGLVGKVAPLLADKLDLNTVGDLLRHYPRRWRRRGDLTDFRDLEVGEFATIFVNVEKVTAHKTRTGLWKTDVRVTDGTRKMTMPFFSKKNSQEWRFKNVTRAFFSGKVDTFNGALQLVNAEVEPLDEGADETDAEFAGAIVSVYPAVKDASTLVIARCVRIVLDTVDLPDDPVPSSVRGQLGLVGIREALEGIHRPKTFDERDEARRRLAWEEAFVLQVVLARQRAAAAALPATARRPRSDGLRVAFDARLPFELTDGQRRIGELIAAEIAVEHPMHRLLQGEVGSGKTVVALQAMLSVIDAGGQAALLAPTEVLAQQHFRSITTMLGDLALGGQLGAADQSTGVTLLTGSLTQPQRRAALLDAASGAAGIVIGTHALLEDRVQFADLGLVVVDEQHKFGVDQRDALRAKARDDRRPHVLVMTATPIPRTIAMTVFGDLDVSTLTDMPKGRAPTTTAVAPIAGKPAWFEAVWQRVRDEVAAGHQAYVVCPRIGGDEPDVDSVADQPDDVDDPTIPGVDPAVTPIRPPIGVLELGPQLVATYLSDLPDCDLARPAAGRRQRRDDARVHRRHDRRARRDHGCRGRRRCRQCNRDGDHGRRAVRRLAAASVARSGRAWRRSESLFVGDRVARWASGPGPTRRGCGDVRRVRVGRARPHLAARGHDSRRPAARPQRPPVAVTGARPRPDRKCS